MLVLLLLVLSVLVFRVFSCNPFHHWGFIHSIVWRSLRFSFVLPPIHKNVPEVFVCILPPIIQRPISFFVHLIVIHVGTSSNKNIERCASIFWKMTANKTQRTKKNSDIQYGRTDVCYWQQQARITTTRITTNDCLCTTTVDRVSFWARQANAP